VPDPPVARTGAAAGRTLVAGANGFLGLSIVRALAESGREVRGLARSEPKAEMVRRAGGSPVLGDILDLTALRRASKGCDSIVHVAAGGQEKGTTPSNAERVRVEGARNLLRAAEENRVRRLVIGSGYWVYADQPGTITESSPTDPRGESRINFETERVGLQKAPSEGVEVMVVRPGMVYGDGAWFRPMIDPLRAGTYRYVGDGTNMWSFVSLPDTGAGFRQVLESGRAGEVYNLVDGRPAPWREFVEFVAYRLGAAVPTGVPPEVAIGVFGGDVTHHLVANRPTSSSKLEALGWRPRYREYRAGVDSVIGAMAAA